MKALKLIQIAGVLTLLIGVAIRTGSGEYYGTVIGIAGLLVYITAKLALWVKSDKS